jgi:hypothetical protein
MRFSIESLHKKKRELEHGFNAILKDKEPLSYTLKLDDKLKCFTISDGETVSLYHIVQLFKKTYDYGEAHVFIVTNEMRDKLISILVDEHTSRVSINEVGTRIQKHPPTFQWL